MERGREDSSGPAHRSSEGADPEEAPRQAAPLGGSLPFNCTARIAVAPTSRSWQRAPTGVSVSPARAAAALRILRHRHHGRLGLQPAGREQVRLHPRYARRGFPGSATGPPGAWGQAGRPGTGPGVGNPRGTCRAPALHGRLKSCGRGDDPGAQPLPSQGGPLAGGQLAGAPWSGSGARVQGALARDASDAPPDGWETQVPAAERGTTPSPPPPPVSSTLWFSVSVLHTPTPVPRAATPRPPVPGMAHSSEPFLNLPKRELGGYPSLLEISLGIPGLLR